MKNTNRIDLPERVMNTIHEHDMIERDDAVIVGLSGGADSVCLLLCLSEIKQKIGFSLRAIHVNHLMRGDESCRDESFCKELCQKLGIPLDIQRVDVFSYMSECGGSSEEAARILRYRAFSQSALPFPAAKIATAHNMCDNSETLLFNITRGTANRGLCGIPYKRDNIIRPLLDISREDIEEYLSAAGQSFVTDSSNLGNDYSRNILRHKVNPILRGINGNLHENIRRLTSSAAEDERFFTEMLSKTDERDICRQHPAVRKRYIRNILEKNNIPCSYERICNIDSLLSGRVSAKIAVGKNKYAVLKNGILTVESVPDLPIDTCFVALEAVKECFVAISEFDKMVKISRFYDDSAIKQVIIHKKSTNNCFSCDKISGDIKIRLRKGSDSVILKGRDFHTRLKKLDSSLGLTLSQRRQAIVLEDDNGVFWAEYVGAAARVACNENDPPEKIYEIKVVSSNG